MHRKSTQCDPVHCKMNSFPRFVQSENEIISIIGIGFLAKVSGEGEGENKNCIDEK
jgi:hypothetical protein